MIHNILFFIGIASFILTMVIALTPGGGFESLSKNIIWFNITCFVASAVAKYIGW